MYVTASAVFYAVIVSCYVLREIVREGGDYGPGEVDCPQDPMSPYDENLQRPRFHPIVSPTMSWERFFSPNLSVLGQVYTLFVHFGTPIPLFRPSGPEYDQGT